MKTIFYWAPFNSKIGTVNSVLNSIKSIIKFSNKTVNPYLIDATFEWSKYEEQYDLIYLRKSKKDFRKLRNKGFFWSRLFFLRIFFSCFLPLKKILKTKKPDFLIVHLITSLPIILFFLFKFETKLILRISGEPKLNLLRKFLWKKISRKIHAVTCPSKETKNLLIESNIFDPEKIHVLYDPIIDISKLKKKKDKIEKFFYGEKYFLSVGRLTNQKNFSFLISCFKDLVELYPDYKLVIIGEGEEKIKLKKKISKLNLKDQVFLEGFKSNVFPYMKNSVGLILTSIYENPGHVLIEAAACDCSIISSDCPTGPAEFLNYGKAGYIFEVNNKNDFIKNVKNFLNESESEKKMRKKYLKKETLKYTLFRHYNALKNII
tara:strand:- start:2412 stop:3539 length:1128 start_codon:yes stop_codon:yes gene_type:complete